jgi:N-acetylglucosaminyl-diphospho-decaprenol L-rhamnosyltransferase
VASAAEGAAVRLVDTDPSAEFAARVAAEHPSVTYVPSANHSYSHAVNVGLAGAKAEYVALMNADVVLRPTTFSDLISALAADSGAGAAGPLALGRDGRPQNLGPLYARHYRALARLRERGAAASPVSVDVPWLSGCLHLIRRTDWEALGGYDPAFRFWNEDLDFGLRLGAAGRRSLLVDASVVHLGGTSTPSHPAFKLEGRRGGLLVGKRHYPAALFAAQRAVVYAEAATGSFFARTPGGRAAHAELLRIVRSGDFGATPFGTTLDERPAW